MPIGIQKQDVWQAADALLIEGARPTIERIRQKIGRGSPNTVSPHLDSWFQALGTRLAGLGRTGDSSSVPDPIVEAATVFWEMALRASRETLSADRVEQEKLFISREQELAAREAEVAEQFSRLESRERYLLQSAEDAREQAATAESRLVSAEATLRDREGEVAQIRADLRKREVALVSAAEKLEQVRMEADHQLSEIEARHLAHERKWMTEIDEERGQRKKLEAAREKQQREIEFCNQELRATHDQLKLSLVKLEKLEQQLAVADRRHESELGHLRQSHDREKSILERRITSAESLVDKMSRGSQEREANLQRLLEAAQSHAAMLLAQLQAKSMRAQTTSRGPRMK